MFGRTPAYPKIRPTNIEHSTKEWTFLKIQAFRKFPAIHDSRDTAVPFGNI